MVVVVVVMALGRAVIHTVGPRFNIKYQTAAESALFSCFRSALSVLKERGYRVLGLPAIASLKRGYPPDLAAHIALRAVRRFMDKYSAHIDRIVFCVSGTTLRMG